MTNNEESCGNPRIFLPSFQLYNLQLIPFTQQKKSLILWGDSKFPMMTDMLVGS